MISINEFKIILLLILFLYLISYKSINSLDIMYIILFYMSLYMYTYSMLLNSYSIYIFSQLLRAFKALKKTPQKQRCPCYDNANTMMGHGFF